MSNTLDAEGSADDGKRLDSLSPRWTFCYVGCVSNGEGFGEGVVPDRPGNGGGQIFVLGFCCCFCGFLHVVSRGSRDAFC